MTLACCLGCDCVAPLAAELDAVPWCESEAFIPPPPMNPDVMVFDDTVPDNTGIVFVFDDAVPDDTAVVMIF